MRKHCTKFRFVKYLREGGPKQADIFLCTDGTELRVVKEFSWKSPLYRDTIGALLIKREVSAYRKLQGLPGVPKFYEKTSPFGLSMEYIEGRDASEFGPGELSPEFFRRLKTLLDRMHSKGVVHGDLGHREGRPFNVLVTADEQPYLIDFSSHIARWRIKTPIREWIWTIFHNHDLRIITHLKQRIAPELLNEEDLNRMEELIPGESWLLSYFNIR